MPEMLGDPLTKDKADAADLLGACVRASADESPTLQRTREEREARSLTKPMVKNEVTGDERLRRTFLEGLTDVVPKKSSTTAAQGRMRVSFPAKAVSSDFPLKTEKAKDAAARGENGQHPDHDGGIWRTRFCEREST